MSVHFSSVMVLMRCLTRLMMFLRPARFEDILFCGDVETGAENGIALSASINLLTRFDCRDKAKHKRMRQSASPLYREL